MRDCVTLFAPERCTTLVLDYQLLTQIKELLNRVTHRRGIENMVVIPAVVEADQFEFEQRLNFVSFGVDHPDYCVIASEFPADDEQILVDLDVEQHNAIITNVYFDIVGVDLICRLELHSLHNLQSDASLIGAVVGERHDTRSQIYHIVFHSRDS